MVSADRIEARAWRTIFPNPDTGCWEWLGYLDARGYGEMSVNNTTLKAHRVVYALYRGAIRAGKQLDHLCHNKQCVRPEHLEPVDRAENVRRHWDHMVAMSRVPLLPGPKRRGRGPADVCARGHAKSGDNLRIDCFGSRSCKACATIAQRARRARKRSVQ